MDDSNEDCTGIFAEVLTHSGTSAFPRSSKNISVEAIDRRLENPDRGSFIVAEV